MKTIIGGIAVIWIIWFVIFVIKRITDHFTASETLILVHAHVQLGIPI